MDPGSARVIIDLVLQYTQKNAWLQDMVDITVTWGRVHIVSLSEGILLSHKTRRKGWYLFCSLIPGTWELGSDKAIIWSKN